MASDAISQDLAGSAAGLVDLRRQLHQHPELAFAEQQTAALVAERLDALGLTARTGVGGSGVVGDVVGDSGGRTLLLRADMDALPLTEVAGRPYGSRVLGVMHGCGHDAHTASLLGAAAMLVARRKELAGRIRLLFQPAEEIAQGALAVMADGVLDGVDAAIAAHVMAPLPYGAVAVWRGDALCGVDFFELTVVGESGHSALAVPEMGAVHAAGRLVVELPAALPPAAGRVLVLAAASIDGGHAANIVADRVTLRGTLRWDERVDRDTALADIQRTIAAVASDTGVGANWQLTASVPPLRNDEALAGVVADAVVETGRAQHVDPGLLPVSDDFAHLAGRIPVCFFGVGAGGPEAPPHHHPAFDIDERAIDLSAELLTRAALRYCRPDHSPPGT